ncbi:MAG: hypothetical protein U1E39_00710 [Planctomycetota bacterium]
MPRELNSTQPFSDKIVKLIPTEIVGAYMVLSGIICGDAETIAKLADPVKRPTVADGDIKVALMYGVSSLLLVLTPAYLRRLSGVKNVAQLLTTTFAFIVWVYSLGGPFVLLHWHHPIAASVILVLWSLAIPLFVKPTPEV